MERQKEESILEPSFICLSPHGAISAPYVMRQKGSIGFQVRKMCQVDEKLCLFGKMLDSNFNIQHRVLTCLRKKSTAGVNGRYVSFCRCFIFNVINTLSVCSLVYLQFKLSIFVGKYWHLRLTSSLIMSSGLNTSSSLENLVS